MPREIVIRVSCDVCAGLERPIETIIDGPPSPLEFTIGTLSGALDVCGEHRRSATLDQVEGALAMLKPLRRAVGRPAKEDTVTEDACPLCPRMFGSGTGVWSHLAVHHNIVLGAEERFKIWGSECLNGCGRHFDNMRSLSQHMRAEIGQGGLFQILATIRAKGDPHGLADAAVERLRRAAQ